MRRQVHGAPGRAGGRKPVRASELCIGGHPRQGGGEASALAWARHPARALQF